jgi:hypothetical protein
MGHFVVCREDKYNNMEDLSNVVLFATTDMTTAKTKLKQFIAEEKANSWIADAMKKYENNYIENGAYCYEDEVEFIFTDNNNGSHTHLQIVKQIIE